MRTTPVLPIPPREYSVEYMDQLLQVLRLYFGTANAVAPLNVASLNIDLRSLPTEAALLTLRSGDVYRDTTADNALKVKV